MSLLSEISGTGSARVSEQSTCVGPSEDIVKHAATATFRLPVWMQVLLVAIFVLQVLPMLFMSAVLGALDFVLIGLLLAFLLPMYTIRLDPEGVQLYGLWRLRWEEIRAAYCRKLFGLPYLCVRRQKGFRWWIPLYFVGDCDLAKALVDAAPPDSPIRSISLPR